MARDPGCSYPSWPWGGVPLSHHSPLEGESQKPSREATADAVGGILSPKAARLATVPLPPTGSPAGCALVSPTPPQGGSDTKEGTELAPLPSRERKPGTRGRESFKPPHLYLASWESIILCREERPLTLPSPSRGEGSSHQGRGN